MADVGVQTGPLLEVCELDAFYGQVQALHNVSLEVQAGEIVAVIGANGAGKTTLLRVLTGLLPLAGGAVRFRQQVIAGLRPDQIVRLGIAHVPERRELFASMTVRENLELGAYPHLRQGGHGGLPLRRRVSSADSPGAPSEAGRNPDLDRVWELFPILRSRQKQVAGTLSGGEQQMLAIARGLMARPELLLLDEPSLGLAPLLVQEVLRIVGQLRLMGCTVLLVEQNAAGALQVADRTYVMEMGRTVMSGSAGELLQDERVRRAYLGQQAGYRGAAPHRNRQEEPARTPARLPASLDDRDRAGARGGGKEQTGTMAGSRRVAFNLSYTLPDEYFEERLSISADQLQALQDMALPQAFAYAYEYSKFYHEKFTAAGLAADSVQGLHHLTRLPFTTTDEIRPDPVRGHTAARLMAVEQREVAVVHRSSGTTGAPKIFPYTGRDAALWAANVATVLWISGLRKNDILLAPGLSREFTGGGGAYLGALALGVTYLPITIGPGVSEAILAHLLGRILIDGKEIVLDPLLRANAIHCLASFLPRLIEIVDDADVQPGELSLTKICCGAEPSSDAVRMRVAERLGIWPRDDYGLGEFYGPGVASECEAGGCLHVLSDTFIAEIVDPLTGEPTPEGEIGELVLTSLHKEALPLFRYRTGDRLMALPQHCACGMAHRRIGRVTGRIHTDDIVIPGGTIINRCYLEEVLLPMDGVGYEYAVTVAEHPTRRGLQQFCLAVEAEGGPELAEVIARRFRMEYQCTPVVHILPLGTIPRTPGKVRRVVSPEEYSALVRPSLGILGTPFAPAGGR